MTYLDELTGSGEFGFRRLVLKGVDNSAVIREHGVSMEQEEVCLFHRDVSGGDAYLKRLHTFVCNGLRSGKEAPVVRFADGEYAFYAESLHCNGLYAQAESVKAIKKATPDHVKALKSLQQKGMSAPLIFPENVKSPEKSFFSFFRRTGGERSALQFLDFLYRHDVTLNADGYVPFYVVYAYLTSRAFAEAIHDKHLCIISSECNLESCQQWFSRYGSRPKLDFVEIPDSYVATRWAITGEDIVDKIPHETELCLVGAGVGALLVCVDVASRLSVPAIDAGHVLNMMNDREDKSNGVRLYTTHKPSAE